MKARVLNAPQIFLRRKVQALLPKATVARASHGAAAEVAQTMVIATVFFSKRRIHPGTGNEEVYSPGPPKLRTDMIRRRDLDGAPIIVDH